MKKLILIVAFVVFNAFFGVAQNSIDKVIYTTTQLQQDFSALRKKLEDKHPNLYLYTNKTTMDSVFDALYNGIAPMNSTQFYYHINTLQPYIKDGHTYLYPSSELQSYFTKHSLYFPFDVRWINQKLYIVQNFSDNKEINIGDELISINGRNASDVFIDMCNHQVRDGNNLAYAEWINQHFFKSYYGYYWGHENTYNLTYKNNNILKIVAVNGLPLDTIVKRKKQANIKLFDSNNYETGIKCDIKNNTAFLYIRSWDDNDLKTKYNQHFKKEIKAIFKKIEEQKVSNLVIDLRNNQGGNYMNGVCVLKHLLQEPFNYFYSFKQLNKNRQLRNKLESLLATKKYRPHSNSFKGQVYVLTNGGSFSNSGIFSSIMQTKKRAVLVGTETGGSGIILTGRNSTKSFYLPNTNIALENTTVEMKVVNIKNEGTGVKPDIEITSTVQDYITNTDVVLQYIINKVENEK